MSGSAPPGPWWAADGNWYPPEPPPPSATWVAIDVVQRCEPCGRQVQPGVRWWDPANKGLHCRACAARAGIGSGPAAPNQPVHAPLPQWRHEDVRRLRLQRDDNCCQCQQATPAGRWAGWDQRAKVVVCESCLDATAVGLTGLPGKSAADEAERRRAELRREAQIIWGDEAANDRFDDRWSMAYDKGAVGEQRLGPLLERLVEGAGWVLHDRAAGRNANIDHIVVVPSGVWVIDSKNYRGKVRVQRRGIFGQVHGMRVRGADRTDVIHGAAWQVDIVRSAVDEPSVPVHLLLAFPRDEAFGWFTKSFQVEGVWCCPPSELRSRLLHSPPALRPEQLSQITGQLSVRLPAKR